MSRLAWSAIAALLVAAAPDLSAQWTNATSTGSMRSVPARYLAARPTALELPSVTRPALPPAKATKTP
jgi:hypothetical protein